MRDFDIIIKLQFLELLNKEEIESLLQFVTDRCKGMLSEEWDQISYSFSNNRRAEKTKVLKFNKKNLNKFYTDIDSSVLNSFEVLKLSENFKVKSRDTDISLHYSAKNEYAYYSSVLLQLDGKAAIKRFSNVDIKRLVIDLVKFLIERDLQLIYGFAFPMEKEKFPKFFAGGIASEYLTAEEEQRAFIWANSQTKSSENLWDVFWGNIFTSKHLGNFLLETERLFGQENIVKMENEVYICFLPIDILSFNEKKDELIESSNKIRRAFAERDRIMQQ